MEAIFLGCGAGGPQLKRNPLGCSMIMIRATFLAFALTSGACIGDRIWLLRTSADLLDPLDPHCIQASLLRLPNVDSVRVQQQPRTSAIPDSTASVLDFAVISTGQYGGWVTRVTRVDSSTTLSTFWMISGDRPPRDSIDNHKRIQSHILNAVAHACAHVEPVLKVVEGDRL